MAKTKYDPEQRAEALRLYDEVGACEAAKRLGIPQATISSWARRTGVQSSAPASTRAAVDHLTLKWAERRLLLTDKLGYLAEHLADRQFDAEPKDTTALAAAMDKAITNAQLLAGAATSRVEHDLGDTDGRLAVVRSLQEQAAKRAAERTEAGA